MTVHVLLRLRSSGILDEFPNLAAYVARGEAALGIVYKTDALIERKVRIVDTFPENSHPPIVYPIALTKTATPAAKDYIAFLSGNDAAEIFKKYGFTTQLSR